MSWTQLGPVSRPAGASTTSTGAGETIIAGVPVAPPTGSPNPPPTPTPSSTLAGVNQPPFPAPQPAHQPPPSVSSGSGQGSFDSSRTLVNPVAGQRPDGGYNQAGGASPVGYGAGGPGG